jgi:1-deoxyxylulose-5-phosphate synthase
MILTTPVMEKRTLRGTSLHVSRACMGTMTFGAQADEAASLRMVDLCLDTANVYNQGLSETIAGKALRGRRGDVVLASKVRGKMGEGPDQSGLSRAAIERGIEESLKRLGTDYLDIYYMHQPDYAVPLEESLEAMDRLVQQGKVRFAASSNYAGWQVCQMQWIAQRRGFKPAAITQPMYNLLARGIEQEYLPMCAELGISTVVYNPLAGGMLTGKQNRQAPLAGTRFDGNSMYMSRYWHEAYFDAVDCVIEAARNAGRSPVSVALNWLLHHSPVDCIILGASKPEQLAQNLKSLDEGPLSSEVLAACDSAWDRIRGSAPKYNR